jgi:dTDP-4-amino-4,6-dideoxygalactose transaminase
LSKEFITFNMPSLTGKEEQYISQALNSKKISGDGFFGKKCQFWLEEYFGFKKTLLTPSCTAALEMAAILINVQPGDEIIMPSYTFVSTANAFVLRGAKIIFVDIRPDNMNIDETLIEAAITSKTKAIVPVHYAGVSCEMDEIMEIANRNNLFVIEDAAQGMMSSYKNKFLGSIGHFATFSFHETKNYTSGGEGGLLVINDEKFIDSANIIREKGTNRSKFLHGEVDKYTWKGLGGSYLMSDLQAAYLWGQLEQASKINENRLSTWNFYYNSFKAINQNQVELPIIQNYCKHNAHIFYLKLKNFEHRTNFINKLKTDNIMSLFHYVPLHLSDAGQKYGVFCGEDRFTTLESERLVRLPIWYGISLDNQNRVINSVKDFIKDSL